MRIACKLCGESFESLIVDREIAWKEVQTKAGNHLKNRHLEKFNEVSKAIQIAAMAIPVYVFNCEETGCIVIPAEDTWITEKLEYCQEIIMKAIGYDAVEDDEELEDDEEGDEEEVEELEPGEIQLPDDGGTENVN